MKQTSYGFTKTVDFGYNEAIEKVTEELQKEVMGELDLKK